MCVNHYCLGHNQQHEHRCLHGRSCVPHCRAILASLTQVVPHCRTAARQLFGKEVPPGPLQMKTLRNADFREVSLEGDYRQSALKQHGSCHTNIC